MPIFDPQTALAHAHKAAPDLLWAGLRYSRESTQTRAVRNDTPEKNETTLEEGAMCEVLVDGHFGYAATADLSATGLQRAFDTAIATTRATSRHKVHSFTAAQRAAVQGVYESPSVTKLAATPLAQITECLLAASKAMAIDAKLVNRSARAMVVQTQIDYYSSNGSHTQQSFDMVDIAVAATAAEGVQSQTRTWGQTGQYGGEVFNVASLCAARPARGYRGAGAAGGAQLPLRPHGFDPDAGPDDVADPRVHRPPAGAGPHLG